MARAGWRLRVIFGVVLAAWAVAAGAKKKAKQVPSHALTPDVLSPELCEEIIAAAEKVGFATDVDSIDDGDYGDSLRPPVWDVQLWRMGAVEAAPVYALVEPHLEKLRELVRAEKRRKGYTDLETSFDWIFIRKYAAGALRDRLRAHTDSNEHSCNVFLNSRVDEQRPVEKKKKKNNNNNNNNGTTDFVGGGIFLSPHVGEKMTRMEWLEDLTDDGIHFPPQERGSAMVHDNTVWHGIAPIEAGTKYSLLLFADMTQRQIYGKGPREVEARIFHDRKTADSLNLVWCGDVSDDDGVLLGAHLNKCEHQARVAPEEVHRIGSFEGHYMVLLNDAGDTVADMVVGLEGGGDSSDGGGDNNEEEAAEAAAEALHTAAFSWAEFTNDSDEALSLYWSVGGSTTVILRDRWGPGQVAALSVRPGRVYEAAVPGHADGGGGLVARWTMIPGQQTYAVLQRQKQTDGEL